jgi:hypothetical protein
MKTRNGGPPPIVGERTAESLASYVSGDDAELSRGEFLFMVATRILDDLHVSHKLTFQERTDKRRKVK